MKINEVLTWSKEIYYEQCICGKEHQVITQHGQGEYETEVYIPCECGEWVEFVLPVN